MNAPKQLNDAGQSIWLDNITKRLLISGTLARYIDQFFVARVTSNPTILQKVISGSDDYDEAIAMALTSGISDPEELVFTVALADLVAAADLLRPVYDSTNGTDGFVSVEVSPDLVDDAEATVAAGKDLFARADRPNVLIKVPGTDAGLIATEELIAAGIPVNVAVLFSPEGALGQHRHQKPELSDTYYLGRLAAADTVNTVPEPTLNAFADHGVVCELMEPDIEVAATVLAAVSAAGVNVGALADTLQVEGAASFQKSWAELLGCVRHKVDHIAQS